jgi:uncharacterized protein YprB with RNaseH-like and TPR domain
MKTATFDIETSGLDAVGSGVLLCAVIKPHGGRLETYRLDYYPRAAPGREHPLLKDVMDRLYEFDILVGHNIIRFDWQWLKSRVIYFEMGNVLKRPFGYDTCQAFRRLGYKTVPNGFGKPSAGLAHVVDFFGFDQEKTALYPRDHWMTVWGDKRQRADAMNRLVDHCKKDVLMNERVFDALLPLDGAAILRRLP